MARVIARKSGHKSDQQVLLSFSPRLIVIADGKRSPTSALLGISRRPRFRSHTGIIAIFRADAGGLSPLRRMLGDARVEAELRVSPSCLPQGRRARSRDHPAGAGTSLPRVWISPPTRKCACATRCLERCVCARTSADGCSRGLWSRYAFEAIRTPSQGICSAHRGQADCVASARSAAGHADRGDERPCRRLLRAHRRDLRDDRG